MTEILLTAKLFFGCFTQHKLFSCLVCIIRHFLSVFLIFLSLLFVCFLDQLTSKQEQKKEREREREKTDRERERERERERDDEEEENGILSDTFRILLSQ